MAGGASGRARADAEFVARSTILDADDVARALRRMAHEIVERNAGLHGVVLIGLQAGGVPFAEALARNLAAIEGTDVAVGTLDVALYRDDVPSRPLLPQAASAIPVDLTDRTVVLVDDVLFTGRTVRAALHALAEFGRPRRVQLAVLVDRGHREVPIRPDYVGKNLPTSLAEELRATLDGVVLGERTAR